MTKIPPKLRAELAADPFYKRCCITGNPGKVGDRIEWHHNLIFGGKQVQARFAILPVLKSLHQVAHERELKDRLDWVMLNRMSAAELAYYSKVIDWARRYEQLNRKFGMWAPWQEAGIAY